jgi:hypothetical protein
VSDELPEGWSFYQDSGYFHDDCPSPLPLSQRAEIREHPFDPDLAVCPGCDASIELEDL